MLAAAALVAGSLAMSAQVAPAQAAAQPGANPDHITVLAAALKKMHDNYASFANFTPGPQDIFDYNSCRACSSPPRPASAVNFLISAGACRGGPGGSD